MRYIILNFHGIGTQPQRREPGEEVYWIAPDRFETIAARVAALRDRVRVGITFDDGNASDLTEGAEGLARHGLTAAFFPLTDRLDTPGNLSAADLRSLMAMGHRIGSHGAAHLDWTRLDAAGFARELDEARAILSGVTGAPVDEAALPFGRYDRRVLAELRRRGYRRVYSSDGGAVRSDRAPLPRHSVRADTSDATLEHWLTGTDGPARRLRRGLGRLKKRML